MLQSYHLGGASGGGLADFWGVKKTAMCLENLEHLVSWFHPGIIEFLEISQTSDSHIMKISCLMSFFAGD